MVLLGLGTALVYPTFLTAIAAATRPDQRAESIGVFRLWRDLGYTIGALLSGWIADVLGIHAAIGAVGLLTVASAIVLFFAHARKCCQTSLGLRC
jgi:MFS family permease